MTAASLINGLISYYKLDESSGDANDIVSLRTLTNTSTTYASSKINNGAVFNGSAYLTSTTPWIIPDANPISYSYWFKVNGTQAYLWMGGMTNQTTRYFMATGIDASGNAVAELAWVSGGNQTVNATSSGKDYRDNMWHHAVNVFSNENSRATVRVYVDGGLVAKATHATLAYTIPSLSYGCQIGAIRNWSSGTYDNKTVGSIDEFGVWNKILSQTEILELYNGTFGSQYPFKGQQYKISTLQNGLQLAWNLNTATVIDSSGFGRNASSTSGYALTTAGKINGGWSSAVNTGYIQGYNADFSGDWSVAIWFKLSTVARNPLLFSKDGATRTMFFQLPASGGWSAYIYYDASNATIISNTAAISLNTWHSAVMTFSRTNGTTVYIDGAVSLYVPTLTMCYNTAERLDISRSYNTLNYGPVGTLDAFMQWNRALSTQEALEYHNSGNGNEYPFNNPAIARYDVLPNLLDYSGNEFNLTQFGTVPTTTDQLGRAGRAASFTRTLTPANYYRISNNLGIQGGPCTISCWVKSNSTPTGYEYFFGQGDASTNVQYFIWYNYNAGNPQLAFTRQRQNTANDQILFLKTLTVGQWYHLAMTYDGATLRGYIDGLQVGSVASTGNGASGVFNNFLIGCVGGNGSSINNAPDGAVASPIVYNEAISAQDVMSLYLSQASYNSILASPGVGYDFRSLLDFSGNNANLTNTNSVSQTSNRFGLANSAYVTNGSSSYLSVADGTYIKPANISIVCVAKAVTLPAASTYPAFFDRMNAFTVDGYRLYISGDSKRIFWELYNGVFVSVPSTTVLNAGQYYYVVATYNGTNVNLYVNGVLEGTAITSGNITYSTTTNGGLSVRTTGTTQYGNYQYEYLTILPYALTSSQVESLYALLQQKTLYPFIRGGRGCL
jgi:hypothetical protein